MSVEMNMLISIIEFFCGGVAGYCLGERITIARLRRAMEKLR